MQSNPFFSVFAFSAICSFLDNVDCLKAQQLKKVNEHFQRIEQICKNSPTSLRAILCDNAISDARKENCIIYSVYRDQIPLNEVREHLLS
ncbi:MULTISPECIES: hypothetical protein [Candidatus Fukatsuia]|uniref:hypothetical protein n=1 Tax=Candidatus Fukatsuia TaxID=1927833 RepID=UPI001F07E4D0|nr:hypothetical protein [Candidatus Fukatsuia symbiotica]